jgi:hypothetical protein
MATEKWVLKRSMHLGYIKESLGAGTVIEHDESKGTLKIEGRVFENTNDLVILKKKDWVVPYSKDAVDQIKSSGAAPVVKLTPQELKEKPKHMQVVKSDSDLMTKEIDIKHTKIAKKEPHDPKAKMEIVKGDETAAERIARLQSEIPKMPIVKDDSLGEVVANKKEPALNAGQVKSLTAEEHEAFRLEGLKKAGLLKEVDDNNPSDIGETETETVIASDNAAFDGDPVKRGRGRPKGSKNAVKIEPQQATQA